MNRTDSAVAVFRGGLNCSQAVLSGFGETMGINPALAAKLGTGLGAGMGRMASVCGAVTGAFLVLGLKHGAATAQDREAKEKTYQLVREFAERFKARNGSIVCRELLGCDIGSPEGLEEAKRREVHNTVCVKLVKDAGDILEELL